MFCRKPVQNGGDGDCGHDTNHDAQDGEKTSELCARTLSSAIRKVSLNTALGSLSFIRYSHTRLAAGIARVAAGVQSFRF